MPDALYIGLMSGTSMDAIDAALLRSSDASLTLLATHQHPIDDQTRQRIAAISHPGEDEIERLGVLDRDLGSLFSGAALALLDHSGTPSSEVRAIGSHGQTIRHRPPSGRADDAPGFTLQIGDPNTIAEMTGITTVADFRRRDVAAGGEGAPLAPAFHAAAFAAPGINRAIVNIGGIANVSVLRGRQLETGFDTGPGNTLLDHWIERHRGLAYDRDGAWAAGGKVCPALLNDLLRHPYFEKSGPRSTGKEDFNLHWLESRPAMSASPSPQDVQATLLQLTVDTIVGAIRGCPAEIADIYVCGGGAHNRELMGRLREAASPIPVAGTGALGLDPDWVEAAAFAWLAACTLDGLPGNAPAVTGASGSRILGGIYPGAQK
jgi:anhydro-N-acetylmuramic acid kinase